MLNKKTIKDRYYVKVTKKIPKILVIKYNIDKTSKTEVLDLLTNETTVFDSMKKAAEFIGCSQLYKELKKGI